MSKFKLAIKLLYGPCQTIATLGGGFHITIKYVMMEFLGHLLKQTFLFLSYLSARSQQNFFFLTVYWATFAIGAHYESPPLLLEVRELLPREKLLLSYFTYPNSSGNVKSTSPLHKGKRICVGDVPPYLIIVIFFTLTQFLELKFYTEKMRKLRQNTQ